jgi:hypothetical protein
MPHPQRQDAQTFYAETHFEQMVRRPGGPLRDEALAAAQLELDELKIGFVDWLNRQLKDLGVALAELDADPRDMAQLDRCYQICAQVQDVGTTMGYDLVTFVAMTLGEILESIKAGAAYEKEMIDCHIDTLFYVMREPHRHLTRNQIAELSSGLRRVADIASISPGNDAP